MYRRLLLLFSIVVLNFVIFVSGHGGHPEEQLIDGIDNGILIFLIMGVLMVGVIIFAWYKGKQIREKMEKEGKNLNIN